MSLGIPVRIASIFATLILLLASRAAAADVSVRPSPQGALIDVPYLSQTPQLCGGAALAMVLRYWGATAVRPQDFADLVDASAGGIATSRLAAAARDRGWQSIPTTVPGDDAIDDIGRHVVQGRPIVALIADSPGVNHYVVVVGVTPAAVVLHDPARAPYLVLERDEFDRRWQASSRWMLIVLPGADPVAAVAIHSEPPTAGAPSPCDALVAQGVAEAHSGRTAAAERVLRSATVLCPDGAAGFRELAGLRLVQQRWQESTELATQATVRNPGDRHAWELLATSRFAAADRLGALDAWNAIERPAIDAIEVEGLRRTHQPVVTTLIGLQPGQLLTAQDLIRAGRRLQELPTSTRSRLQYTPLERGDVTVSAFVNEAPRFPSGLVGWAGVAARALMTDDIRVDLSALASQGDLWQPAFRWPRERRRVGLGLTMPTPGFSGIVRVEGFRERQTYARPAIEGGRSEEVRRRIGASYANWITAPWRVEFGAASDRLDGSAYLALNGATTIRISDYVAAHLRAERWVPVADSLDGITAGEMVVDWRSANTEAPPWTARAGMAAVSGSAPLALWPGAGAMLDRTALLRGRPLIRSHVLSGEVFGKRLAFATVERQHVIYEGRYGGLSIAGFADTAKAWDRLDSGPDSPFHVDVGTGLRLFRPGDTNHVRLDLGVGVRDGRIRASAGYVRAWGRR